MNGNAKPWAKDSNGNPKNFGKQNATKVFQIVDGNTLLKREFEPLKFAVEKILPHGLFLIAGSGKIGKSFFCLDLCMSVATGGKMWEFQCEHGDVLYLALEDNCPRLQDRLNKIRAGSADISRLKLATAAFGIGSGLIEQTHHHLAKFPETRLIVIDTLERVGDTEFDDNIYACDYRDMTDLRRITNKHELTLLLVHHTRKLRDKDPLNTLSGSMGLVGAVDGVFVLEKLTRSGDDAVLTIANRDTQDFCFRLRFDRESCKWLFVGNHEDEPAERRQGERDEWLALLIGELVQEEWSGTATELCDALRAIDAGADVVPLTISRRLKGISDFLAKSGIAIELGRDRSSRTIRLARELTSAEES